MKNVISDQLVQAAVSFLWGLGSGWLYDFFSQLRRMIKNGIFTSVCDGIYWLLCGTGFFVTAFSLCGKTRLFMLILALCGGTVYFSLLRPLGTAIWKGILKPFRMLGRWIEEIVNKIKFFLKNIFSTYENRFNIDKNHHAGKRPPNCG